MAFDYKAVGQDLETLHHATCGKSGYYEDHVAKYIYVGEYALALDGIACVYVENSVRMSPEDFLIFERIADAIDVDDDPEYSVIPELRAMHRSDP